MSIAFGEKVRGDRFTFESEILIEAADHGIRTLAVAIPGRYPPNARPSHFRPVVDIAKIVVMVASRLLKKGPLSGGSVAQPATGAAFSRQVTTQGRMASSHMHVDPGGRQSGCVGIAREGFGP